MKLSVKAQSRARRIRTAMRQWRRERGPDGQFCFFCLVAEGNVWLGLSVHHILRRSRAPGLVDHPANFLLLCARCHDKCDSLGTFSIKAQLQQKRLHDPENYDPEPFRGWL